MFPHRKIHKYTMRLITLDRGQQSSTLDDQSFGGTDCDTDLYVDVAKLRQKKLSVCNEQHKRLICQEANRSRI
jgi:hypothetical protein